MAAKECEMRKSLVVEDGKLRFCPVVGMSCIDWLVKGEGMSEDEFAKVIHGALYPGRVYFYKGVDTTVTDEEVEEVAMLLADQFDTNTEICCGAIPGEVGTIWEPRVRIGYGTKTGR